MVLGIAGVDLIYARLSVLLCAVDRLLEVQKDDLRERTSPPGGQPRRGPSQ